MNINILTILVDTSIYGVYLSIPTLFIYHTENISRISTILMNSFHTTTVDWTLNFIPFSHSSVLSYKYQSRRISNDYFVVQFLHHITQYSKKKQHDEKKKQQKRKEKNTHIHIHISKPRGGGHPSLFPNFLPCPVSLPSLAPMHLQWTLIKPSSTRIRRRRS